MSHFYASIEGSRDEATRQGTAASGIRGHIRGWHAGIQAKGFVGAGEQDKFDVYLTAGSIGAPNKVFIGQFSEGDLGKHIIVLKAETGTKYPEIGSDGAIDDRGRQSLWDAVTKVEHLCEFIDKLGLADCLDKYLQSVQREEGSFVEE